MGCAFGFEAASTNRRERVTGCVVAILCTLVACSDRDTGRKTASENAASPRIDFVNKVWKVVESPAGPTGDLYVFLSDGTFVRAAPEAVPQVGKWNYEGESLKVIEGGLPYDVDILALDDSGFRIRCRHQQGSYELRFVPAEPSLPVRRVEFDPAEHSISAHGSDPAWLVSVDGATASLRSAAEGSLDYAGGVWEGEDASSWRYDAFRAFEGGDDTLSLIIRNESCIRDSSGAEYPLSATLIRKGVWLKGCAIAGWPRKPPSSGSEQ
jgi:uncharacterized membrane protein